MDLPLAVGISAALFAASLVVNAVAGRIVSVDLESMRPKDLPWSMWIVGMVSVVVLAPLGTWWYFAVVPVSPNAAGGLALGAAMVVTGMILDCAFILPLKDGRAIMMGYFKAPQYWITLVLLVASCVLTSILLAAV